MAEIIANFTLGEINPINATFSINNCLSQSQIDKIETIILNGDGTKYLSDQGNYKAIPLPDLTNYYTKTQTYSKTELDGSLTTINATIALKADKTYVDAQLGSIQTALIKNEQIYPVDGWFWFDTEEEARTTLNIVDVKINDKTVMK